MSISAHDLEAVRAVLDGTVTTAEAAVRYTSVQKVVLAHAALLAGNYSRPSWKSEFSELLEEMALAPARPAGGWIENRDNENYFSREPGTWRWYYFESERLMPTSRRLGLHTADRQGNHLALTPPEALRQPLTG